MSDALSASSIVHSVAQEAAQRVTRKVIADLQQMKDKLSGDDSGLETTWDEICVQVQDEHSALWDAYDMTVRDIVAGYVADLPIMGDIIDPILWKLLSSVPISGRYRRFVRCWSLLPFGPVANSE